MLCASRDFLFFVDENLKSLENRLFPLAVSRDDIDLFIIVLGNGTCSGNVIWIAGGEIERFKTFSEYFKAMISYNKKNLNILQTKITFSI